MGFSLGLPVLSAVGFFGRSPRFFDGRTKKSLKMSFSRQKDESKREGILK